MFFVHFLILTLILAVLLLWDKLSVLPQYMEKNGANYLYALFCALLLIIILYCYFLFENQEILLNGNSMALVFAVLDVYVIISYLVGSKIGIYARPVAFVALMILTLVGRREAIFLNIISALLMFVVDTFVGTDDGTQIMYYSSLIISFSAGMFAIFFCEKTKTRFGVMGIGIFIVLPIDLIILLLDQIKYGILNLILMVCILICWGLLINIKKLQLRLVLQFRH